MRYYKARTVDYAPYLIFDCIAKSKDDAINRKIIDDKGTILVNGVVPEVPKDIYGVCPKILDDEGQLIDRPAQEIDAAKITFEKAETEKAIFEENRTNYQQFKALWQKGTNQSNYARYREEIQKVVADYDLTGIFEIEHKGLRAFAISEGIRLPNQ